MTQHVITLPCDFGYTNLNYYPKELETDEPIRMPGNLELLPDLAYPPNKIAAPIVCLWICLLLSLDSISLLLLCLMPSSRGWLWRRPDPILVCYHWRQESPDFIFNLDRIPLPPCKAFWFFFCISIAQFPLNAYLPPPMLLTFMILSWVFAPSF